MSALTSLQVDSAISYVIALVMPALDAIFPVLPSETAIIALGVATAGSTNPLIAVLVGCAAAGAFIGDNLCYLLGRRFGPVAERRFFTTRRGRAARAWAERSLGRFGTQIVIACRFIPGGRTAVTLSCGLTGYPRGRFVPATAVAGTIWALYAFFIGRIGGKAFEDSPLTGLLIASGAATAVSLAVAGVRRFRGRTAAGARLSRGHAGQVEPDHAGEEQRHRHGPVPRAGGSRLALRLALAFVAVALAAVSLLAGLTSAFAASDISSLASQQRQELARAIAAAAGPVWDRNGTWTRADLSPVLNLAAHTGTNVQVLDAAGDVIATSPGFAAQAGPQASTPVFVRDQRVGTAVTRSTGSGLYAADRLLQSALLRAIAGAAGLAALLALVTALAVARRITRPVARLIAVTRAMAAGDRAARVREIRAAGELRELAGAFDQMAETVNREEQIRRDMVADLAHELRTPVAVLQAGHEALLDGVAEPTPEELGSLRDEVLRLARMVGDLQTLAAADAAGLHLAREPCDLAAIAADTASSLAHRFEAAGIAVDRQLSEAWVLADPQWMPQVITNLLTNTLKFTPVGGRATISTGRAGPDAVLRVTDTGMGIPAGDLPHIFDRFWRGPHAARVSGSGIGLAIAAGLAQAHGGRLTASSRPGRGTQMTLTLPAFSRVTDGVIGMSGGIGTNDRDSCGPEVQ